MILVTEGTACNSTISPPVLSANGISFPSDGKVTNLSGITQVYYLSKNVAIPYIQQWNIGLGSEFAKHYVTYAGSKGTQLFGTSQLFNNIDLTQYANQFLAGLNMSDLFPNPAGIKDRQHSGFAPESAPSHSDYRRHHQPVDSGVWLLLQLSPGQLY